MEDNIILERPGSASLVAQTVRNLPAMLGSIPGSGRSRGEGNGYPLIFLPGEFHGHRTPAGYSMGSQSRTRLSK